jgi:hypothetical protein
LQPQFVAICLSSRSGRESWLCPRRLISCKDASYCRFLGP